MVEHHTALMLLLLFGDDSCLLCSQRLFVVPLNDERVFVAWGGAVCVEDVTEKNALEKKVLR